MGKTNIAWTDYSLNFIKWFCTKISPGCQNCYMFPMAKRWAANATDRPVWRANSIKELHKIPTGAFVFVGDMYDQYHEQMPVEWIHNVHNMAAYERPDLQFQMLTKRIERVAQLAPHLIWPDNLWMGTTVESPEYTWRIDYLRDIPAKTKFISFEPLLGDVGNVDLTAIDMTIVGAESGAGRRPFDKEWARNIRTQCRKYDTPFFYKQSSGMKPGTDPCLDGRIYHEFPRGMSPLKGKPEPHYRAGDQLARDRNTIEVVSPRAGRHGNLVRLNHTKEHNGKRIMDGSSFTVAPEQLAIWIAGKPSPISQLTTVGTERVPSDKQSIVVGQPVVAKNETTTTPQLNQIVNANSLDYLHQCQSNTVHTIITSPPYWGLRDYDTDPIDWPAISFAPMPGIPEIEIPAMTASLGQEPDLNAFIGHLVLIFREARRVLHDTGTAWINMGDSYAGTNNGYSGDHRPSNSRGGSISSNNAQRTVQQKNTVGDGLKPKDMMMQPSRLALALQADGWYLRSDIIWQKTNGSPASYKDRPTLAHEYVFLLAKSKHYYYDWLAIAEPVKQSSIERLNRGVSDNHKNMNIPGQKPHGMHKARANGENEPAYAQKNKRSVWTTSTGKFKDAHFATFPEKLIEPMARAGCPIKVCDTCLSPWTRITKKTFIPQEDVSPERGIKGGPGQKSEPQESNREGQPRGTTHYKTVGWQPTCKCTPAPTVPGTVMDIFMGSGTTALVAKKNGMNYMGCDLNTEYVEMANKRLSVPTQTDMFHGDKIPTVIKNSSVTEHSSYISEEQHEPNT